MILKKYFFPCLIIAFACIAFNAGAQNTWVQKANFGGGNRLSACAFSIGTTGYVMTGVSADSDCADMWAWKQDSNIWVKKSLFPGGTRTGASAVSMNGYGYVIGGEHPSNCYLIGGGGVCGGTFYNDIWQYDPAADTWTSLPAFPGLGRNNAVAIADPDDSTIYFGTGNDNDSVFLTDWWAYNVTTASWKQLKSFPAQRQDAVGFYVDGNIYLATGDNDDGKEDATGDVWKYDKVNDTWIQMANMPGDVRRQASAFVIGSQAYVCMGVRSNSVMLNDMWMYDPATDTWTAQTSYPGGPAYGTISFSIGEKGYVGTGAVGATDTSLFWEYTSTVTAVNKISSNEGISIYPNPNNGIIHCSYSGLTGNSRLVITDILGGVIDTRSINNKQGVFTLNESNLSNGVYFYRIITSGKPVFTGKLVIAR